MYTIFFFYVIRRCRRRSGRRDTAKRRHHCAGNCTNLVERIHFTDDDLPEIFVFDGVLVTSMRAFKGSVLQSVEKYLIKMQFSRPPSSVVDG